MKYILFFFVIIALGFSLPAFSQDGKKMEILQMWEGNGAATSKSDTAVVRTQDQWIKLWTRTEQKSIVQPLLKGQMAVGIFSGNRLTTGYRVMIADVVEKPGNISVIYRELRPSQTRIKPMPYETSPWAIAVLPYSDKPVVFKQERNATIYYIKKIANGVVDFLKSLLVSGIHKVQKP